MELNKEQIKQLDTVLVLASAFLKEANKFQAMLNKPVPVREKKYQEVLEDVAIHFEKKHRKQK